MRRFLEDIFHEGHTADGAHADIIHQEPGPERHAADLLVPGNNYTRPTTLEDLVHLLRTRGKLFPGMTRDDLLQEALRLAPDLRMAMQLADLILLNRRGGSERFAAPFKLSILGHEPGVRRAASTVLGNSTELEHFGHLAGAGEGSRVSLRAHPKGGLIVSVQHPDYRSQRRIYRDPHGALAIENTSTDVLPQRQGAGVGTSAFSRQLSAARRLGVSYIHSNASGEPGSDTRGYYALPRQGFDQPLRQLDASWAHRDAAAKLFPHAKTVQDIFQSPGGADWWRQYGTAMPQARFDLAEGSRSQAAWDSYESEQRRRNPHAFARNSSPEYYSGFWSEGGRNLAPGASHVANPSVTGNPLLAAQVPAPRGSTLPTASIPSPTLTPTGSGIAAPLGGTQPASALPAPAPSQPPVRHEDEFLEHPHLGTLEMGKHDAFLHGLHQNTTDLVSKLMKGQKQIIEKTAKGGALPADWHSKESSIMSELHPQKLGMNLLIEATRNYLQNYYARGLAHLHEKYKDKPYTAEQAVITPDAIAELRSNVPYGATGGAAEKALQSATGGGFSDVELGKLVEKGLGSEWKPFHHHVIDAIEAMHKGDWDQPTPEGGKQPHPWENVEAHVPRLVGSVAQQLARVEKNLQESPTHEDLHRQFLQQHGIGKEDPELSTRRNQWLAMTEANSSGTPTGITAGGYVADSEPITRHQSPLGDEINDIYAAAHQHPGVGELVKQDGDWDTDTLKGVHKVVDEAKRYPYLLDKLANLSSNGFTSRFMAGEPGSPEDILSQHEERLARPINLPVSEEQLAKLTHPANLDKNTGRRVIELPIPQGAPVEPRPGHPVYLTTPDGQHQHVAAVQSVVGEPGRRRAQIDLDPREKGSRWEHPPAEHQASYAEGYRHGHYPPEYYGWSAVGTSTRKNPLSPESEAPTRRPSAQEYDPAWGLHRAGRADAERWLPAGVSAPLETQTQEGQQRERTLRDAWISQAMRHQAPWLDETGHGLAQEHPEVNLGITGRYNQQAAGHNNFMSPVTLALHDAVHDRMREWAQQNRKRLHSLPADQAKNEAAEKLGALHDEVQREFFDPRLHSHEALQNLALAARPEVGQAINPQGTAALQAEAETYAPFARKHVQDADTELLNAAPHQLKNAADDLRNGGFDSARHLNDRYERWMREQDPASGVIREPSFGPFGVQKHEMEPVGEWLGKLLYGKDSKESGHPPAEYLLPVLRELARQIPNAESVDVTHL